MKKKLVNFASPSRTIEDQRKKVLVTGLLGGKHTARHVFVREGEPWTLSEQRDLMTCLLCDAESWVDFHRRKNNSRVCDRFQRTFDSLYAMFKRVAGRYEAGAHYLPLRKPIREGAPFNMADKDLLNHAYQECGRRHGANNLSHVSRVMMRPLVEVRRSARVRKWLKQFGATDEECR